MPHQAPRLSSTAFYRSSLRDDTIKRYTFVPTEGALVDDLAHHPLECVQFVREALAIAQLDRELSPSGIADATGVCRVVLELAVDQFGTKGKDVLIAWGISRSEDVGTLIYRLIEMGLVKQAASDSVADFDDLFNLRSPPESWRLRW